MSDTPRTDEHFRIYGYEKQEYLLDHARQLERELAEAHQRAQNAEGMADCMRMVRDELVEAGIIDAGVAPMFIPEAVAGKLAEARRELEVWSRRYADLEVLYLAALKS